MSDPRKSTTSAMDYWKPYELQQLLQWIIGFLTIFSNLCRELLEALRNSTTYAMNLWSPHDIQEVLRSHLGTRSTASISSSVVPFFMARQLSLDRLWKIPSVAGSSVEVGVRNGELQRLSPDKFTWMASKKIGDIGSHRYPDRWEGGRY